MELAAALTTHIRTLSEQIEVERPTVEAVGALSCDLTQAVASYLGLQLVLVEHGRPVTLTLLDPVVEKSHISASLRLTLSALRIAGADPHSTITFYAGAPGAFVDLAADLTFALKLPTSVADQERAVPGSAPAAISVDAPLLPSTLESGLAGARELSTVNRAIGILIGEGHHPDQAPAELRRRAAATGVTVSACATRLVRPRSR